MKFIEEFVLEFWENAYVLEIPFIGKVLVILCNREALLLENSKCFDKKEVKS